MVAKEFDEKSSVDRLKLVVLFKKLEAKREKGFTPGEQKLFDELSQKLGSKPELKAKELKIETSTRDDRIYIHEPLQIHNRRDFQKFFLKNISGGGVYLESNQNYSIGTQIDFEMLWVDKKQNLKFRGEVAWINPKTLGELKPGFGVKFVNPTDQQKQMIKEMINQLLTKATASTGQKKKK